jgi:NADPH-dependent 2,4-dienoyl-CoA reductase/sulfur reductase-like enzyme
LAKSEGRRGASAKTAAQATSAVASSPLGGTIVTDDLAGADPATGLPEPEPTQVAPDDLATPQHGLEPRAQASKRVIVIGAGLAGLVAAFVLARQGHDPIVLEAQNRVGGRVYTMR